MAFIQNKRAQLLESTELDSVRARLLLETKLAAMKTEGFSDECVERMRELLVRRANNTSRLTNKDQEFYDAVNDTSKSLEEREQLCTKSGNSWYGTVVAGLFLFGTVTAAVIANMELKHKAA